MAETDSIHAIVNLINTMMYIRGGKESIVHSIAVSKHPLKSTVVNLAKITSASITVMVTHPGV